MLEQASLRKKVFSLVANALIAENKASKKIIKQHTDEAIKKLDEFNIKKSTDLKDDLRIILNIIKDNSGQKIGDLFKIYKEKGGDTIYKTFQRSIKKLEQGKFITTKKITGGPEGSTTIITYQGSLKKLTDF